MGHQLFRLIFLCCLFALSGSPRAEDADYGSEVPLMKVPDSAPCGALAVAGDYLYAAARGTELHVYRIADPRKPERVGVLGGLERIRQMVWSDGFLYVTARQSGLWVVDVRNPAKPSVAARFDTVEMATGVTVSGPYLFVAQRVYGVQVLDVSDPFRPRHLTMFRTKQAAQSVLCRDGRLYAGIWRDGLVSLFDVADPANPKSLGVCRLDGFGDGVDIVGNLCYAATGHHSKSVKGEAGFGRGHGLELWSVKNPERPHRLSRVDFPRFYNLTNDYWTVRVSGQTAFVVDTHNGLFVVDASDPLKPKCVGRGVLPERDFRFAGETRKLPDVAAALALGDGVVYVGGHTSGLYLAEAPRSRRRPEPPSRLDVGAPPDFPTPAFHRASPGGLVRRVTVAGDLAFAACSDAGLRVYRLSEDGLRELHHYPVKFAFDAAVHGDRLVTLENYHELAVYRISGDGRLEEMGRAHTRPRDTLGFLNLYADGRYAATGGGETLWVYDLLDPSAPRVVFQHRQVGLLYCDLISRGDIDGEFCVNWLAGGSAFYTLLGEKPRLIRGGKELALGGQNDGIAVLGRRFLAAKNGKYLLIDPKRPEENRVCTPDEPKAVGLPSVDGDLAAFAHRADGTVSLFDFRDPENARIIKERSFRFAGDGENPVVYGHPDRVAFWRGKMVIPAGYLGLLLEK